MLLAEVQVVAEDDYLRKSKIKLCKWTFVPALNEYIAALFRGKNGCVIMAIVQKKCSTWIE